MKMQPIAPDVTTAVIDSMANDSDWESALVVLDILARAIEDGVPACRVVALVTCYAWESERTNARRVECAAGWACNARGMNARQVMLDAEAAERDAARQADEARWAAEAVERKAEQARLATLPQDDSIPF